MEKKIDQIPLNNMVSFYEFLISPINHVTIIADEQEVMGVGYAFSPEKSRLRALREAFDKGYKDYVLPTHLFLINYQMVYKGNIVREIENLVITSYWAKVYCLEFRRKIDELDEMPWREKIADTISSDDHYVRFEARIVPVEALKEEDILQVLATGGKVLELGLDQTKEAEAEDNQEMSTKRVLRRSSLRFSP